MEGSVYTNFPRLLYGKSSTVYGTYHPFVQWIRTVIDLVGPVRFLSIHASHTHKIPTRSTDRLHLYCHRHSSTPSQCLPRNSQEPQFFLLIPFNLTMSLSGMSTINSGSISVTVFLLVSWTGTKKMPRSSMSITRNCISILWKLPRSWEGDWAMKGKLHMHYLVLTVLTHTLSTSFLGGWIIGL